MPYLGIILTEYSSTNQTYGGSSTPYRMQVDSVVIQGDKNPLTIGLPANARQVVIDLGFSRFTVQLQGLVDEASGTDGGITIPSKRQLEDFCLVNYANDKTVEVVGTTNIDKYGVVIRSVRFTMDAAKENRWEYLLVFNGTFRL